MVFEVIHQGGYLKKMPKINIFIIDIDFSQSIIEYFLMLAENSLIKLDFLK